MTKHTISVGMKVEGGSTVEDYDAGRVVDVDGDDVTVAWDSGVRTTQRAAALRPLGTDAPPTMQQTRELRDEAAEAGDEEMVALCERALDSVGSASNKVWAAIRNARAQA